MKNIFVFFLMIFFSSINHAGKLEAIKKIINGVDNVNLEANPTNLAKGAVSNGIAAKELEDAAKAYRLSLTHPPLPLYQTALIINNHYPWATKRLAACLGRHPLMDKNENLLFCTSQYQKCIDSKQITTLTLNEACITQTNKN